MTKKLKVIISAIVGVVLLAAVVVTTVVLTNKARAKFDGQITIVVLGKEGEELVNKEVGYNAGDTFVDILDKNINIVFETNPSFGRFIVTIEGQTQGDDYWWTYTRNNEYTETGVDMQEFADGDVFEFKLFKWE